MKAWRDSASLVLAARHGQKYNRSVAATHNYSLLCLKRHQKSSFMPGSYVFPGGVVDPADSDVKWRELFATLGFDSGSLASLVPRVATRPQIFLSGGPNELPREISLRITAIRETFEESGVLLCRPRRDEVLGVSNWTQHMSIPRDELQAWQKKIHQDATRFFELCEKLQCCPDLWALHEWANWLTPTFIGKSRYDTIFYLACTPYKPNAEYESSEMEDLQWKTPENLQSFAFPIPQTYIFAELMKLKDFDTLLNSAVERNKDGVQLYFPVSVNLKDGLITVLPGDAMYPKQVNLMEQPVIDKSDMTVAEYREMTPIKNRLEFHDAGIQVVSDILLMPSRGVQECFEEKKTTEGPPQQKNKL